MAETQKHNMRIPPEIWGPAKKKADGLRVPLTQVVCQALKDFVKEDRAKSAKRYNSPIIEAQAEVLRAKGRGATDEPQN